MLIVQNFRCSFVRDRLMVWLGLYDLAYYWWQLIRHRYCESVNTCNRTIFLTSGHFYLCEKYFVWQYTNSEYSCFNSSWTLSLYPFLCVLMCLFLYPFSCILMCLYLVQCRGFLHASIQCRRTTYVAVCSSWIVLRMNTNLYVIGWCLLYLKTATVPLLIFYLVLYMSTVL